MLSIRNRSIRSVAKYLRASKGTYGNAMRIPLDGYDDGKRWKDTKVQLAGSASGSRLALQRTRMSCWPGSIRVIQASCRRRGLTARDPVGSHQVGKRPEMVYLCSELQGGKGQSQVSYLFPQMVV